MGEKKLRMNAYYYSFESTGCGPIDEILSAVANVGRAHHNTRDWDYSDCGDDGLSPADRIQNAANEAASLLNPQNNQKPECSFDCDSGKVYDCDNCEYQTPF